MRSSYLLTATRAVNNCYLVNPRLLAISSRSVLVVRNTTSARGDAFAIPIFRGFRLDVVRKRRRPTTTFLHLRFCSDSPKLLMRRGRDRINDEAARKMKLGRALSQTERNRTNNGTRASGKHRLFLTAAAAGFRRCNCKAELRSQSPRYTRQTVISLRTLIA